MMMAPPGPTQAVTTDAALIREVGLRLAAHYGDLHWWPAESPFEVVVGAVLTQNTAWTNVERAIANLRTAGLLNAPRLRRTPHEELEGYIRPSGTYRVKARRLAALLEWLGDDWQAALVGPTEDVRRALLRVPGIGGETADAILLYSAGHPTFVIDAYTRRIMTRLGVHPAVDSYDGWRCLFMTALPANTAGFNAYHAGLVQLGKDYCRPNPRCEACPLRTFCPTAPT